MDTMAAQPTDPQMALAPSTLPAAGHRIRRFNYDSDLQDLMDICANVYGGTDYMPRVIHRIASDPGVLVLAAEVQGEGEQPGEAEVPAEVEDRLVCGQQRQPWIPVPEQEQERRRTASRIDGIICGERRGDSVFLFGLRVREGVRGRGLGHLLMEAICARAPGELSTSADAEPPPPASPATAVPQAVTPQAITSPPSTPATPSAASLVLQQAAAALPRQPIRHIVSCTTSYNPAAQRIIGRQLPGPLYQVECWPGHGPLERYQQSVGWVRGRGVPQGAPNMLDWIPGARAALASDGAAGQLTPRWRRTTCGEELRRVVTYLLYGNGGGGCCCSGSGSGGGGGGGGGGGVDRATEGLLLWLPLPYEVWSLDSAFIRRELAAENIWVLTRGSVDEGPTTASGEAAAVWTPHVTGRAVDRKVVTDGDCGGACGGRSSEGVHSDLAAAADEEEEKEEEKEGEIPMGVMLVTYYETYGMVCAGILAADNATAHAATTHAATLHPHFMACTLRRPGPDPGTSPPPPHSGDVVAAATAGHRSSCSSSNNTAATSSLRHQQVTAPEPVPALYDMTGGFRDFWVYGRQVGKGNTESLNVNS